MADAGKSTGAHPIKIAFLAEGQLYTTERGGRPEPVVSAYLEQVRRVEAKSAEKRAWKSGGGDSMQARMVWGKQGDSSARERIDFISVAPGRTEGSVIYFLASNAVGGLFEQTLGNGEERRLFHRQGYRAENWTRHPVDGRLACSETSQYGACHLAVGRASGAGIQTATEGESADTHPAWGLEEDMLYFQSAGVARRGDGAALGHGPSAIELLNLSTGKLKTVLEDTSVDYLVPRWAASGDLYYIQRPYVALRGMDTGILVLLKDIVCFPWRLLRTMVGFLNALSLMFTQKPLYQSGGPRHGREAENLRLWLYGRVIDAAEARQKPLNADEALVPADWKLVRRDPKGAETVVATNVLAYDLIDQGRGGLLYTNGSRIWRLDPDGKKELWGKGGPFTEVLWIGEVAPLPKSDDWEEDSAGD
jgi:hypothetical protein